MTDAVRAGSFLAAGPWHPQEASVLHGFSEHASVGEVGSCPAGIDFCGNKRSNVSATAGRSERACPVIGGSAGPSRSQGTAHSKLGVRPEPPEGSPWPSRAIGPVHGTGCGARSRALGQEGAVAAGCLAHMGRATAYYKTRAENNPPPQDKAAPARRSHPPGPTPRY